MFFFSYISNNKQCTDKDGSLHKAVEPSPHSNAAELSFERDYNFCHIRVLWNMQHMDSVIQFLLGQTSHCFWLGFQFCLWLQELKGFKEQAYRCIACRIIYSLQSECFILAWCFPWLAGQPRSYKACCYCLLAWPLHNVFSLQSCSPSGIWKGIGRERRCKLMEEKKVVES